METDNKNPTQAAARVPEQPTSGVGNSESRGEKQQKTRGPRKDKSRLHAAGHAILSQFPLEALARLGENVRRLRRIERRFRTELRPSGILGALWFDRFWSSYLRCLLAAKVEGMAIAPIDQPTGRPRCTPSVKDGELPVLIRHDDGITREALAPDLLGYLALVARYDRHFSREMYRALAMLLILRSRGEAGLEECIGRMVGLENENH